MPSTGNASNASRRSSRNTRSVGWWSTGRFSERRDAWEPRAAGSFSPSNKSGSAASNHRRRRRPPPPPLKPKDRPQTRVTRVPAHRAKAAASSKTGVSCPDRSVCGTPGASIGDIPENGSMPSGGVCLTARTKNRDLLLPTRLRHRGDLCPKPRDRSCAATSTATTTTTTTTRRARAPQPTNATTSPAGSSTTRTSTPSCWGSGRISAGNTGRTSGGPR
mmetsp:Transcript_1109/g.2606  ORF Transcript_1109/g.2606 Transcript_1109/m.2606 type:complete len:219 (-) Transcript_1109:310-966(-)